MTPERWRRVDEIFAATADVPAEQISAFLDRECNGDLSLRHDVEALLSYDTSHKDGLFEGAVAQAAEMISITRTEVRQDMAEKRVGTRIGHYLLKQVIGFGGMGVVYLGVRDDAQMQKRVAVKLVQQGRDSKFIRDRFHQERQILAQLEHPNIARFIDGGLTTDDLPYYVMEYVEDGESIVDYCCKKNLPLRQRLSLFLQVCAAVNYAHRNLVVHRDLKPGNVLVGTGGVLKLVDFGIAKVLSEDAAGGSQTQTMVRMLTPDYASPEQVHSLPITTATDVYSLGAILYELLSGHPAHRFKNYSNTEIERVVCMEDPLRPSRAVLLGEPSPEKQRLSKELQSDLDSIVAMAMRKEPNHRYPSVEQLMDDVENYIAGRPVMAHHGTIRYRAGKFVRRHKLPMAAGVALVLTLVGGIGATTYQARRAERRFQQVRQLASTLLNEFDTRVQSLPQSVELRQWMSSTVVQYLDNLAEEAGSDDGLQLELAQGYSRVAQLQGAQFQANLGQSQSAIGNYRKSLELYSRLSAADTRNVQVQNGLCQVTRMLGQAEVFAGNVSKGRPILEQGLQHGDRLSQLSPSAGHECLIGCYAGLVAVEFSSANAGGAIPFINRQLEHAKALAQLQPSSEAQLNIISAKLSLATAQLQSGDAPRAMRTAEELAMEAEKTIGPQDPSYQRLRLRILDLIGDIAGNPREIHLLDRKMALASYQTALAMAEQNFSRDSQDARYRRDLDRALRKLALLVVDEDAEQATRLAQRALTLSEIHLKNSPGNPEYMRDQIDGLLILGYASETRKHWPEALVFLQKALAQQLELQRGSPETRRFKREIQETQEALGDVYLQLGNEKESLASYEKGMELTVSMLWERPTDAYLLRDLTDNHEALAEYYAAQARKGGTTAHAHWKKAVEYQRKSVEAWSDWSKKVAGGPYPVLRLEEAKKTLELLERALAKS